MNQDLLRTLTSVKPEYVQHYLTKTGWTKADYKKIDQIKYQLPSMDVFVLVPKNAKSSDYSQSLKNIVRTISQVEERDESAVVKNILNPNVDVLKFRFMGSSADLGSLPLDYTRRAIDSIRDALIFSACSEINQKPSYSKQLPTAVRMIEKSRFGQTEIGSFVISVELPLDMPVSIKTGGQSTLTGIDAVSPKERRIISRILRGAEKARNVAIAGDQVDPENDYKTNLNANLAESLASLRDDGLDVNIELSAQWDRSIPFPDLPNSPVLIEERTFESLVSISNVLRGSISSRFVEFTGKIASLFRDDTEDDDSVGDNTVTIRTNRDDVPKNVKVSLSLEDYQKACDYHRDKKGVSIKGTLEKSGKSWMLTGYSDFTGTVS